VIQHAVRIVDLVVEQAAEVRQIAHQEHDLQTQMGGRGDLAHLYDAVLRNDAGDNACPECGSGGRACGRDGHH